MTNPVQDKTIEDFNHQWRTYTDNSGYYGSSELLSDIVSPLIEAPELAGKVIAEVGSGTGRIVRMLLSAGANRVYAVEPGPDAFSVLKKNTKDGEGRITYLNAIGSDLPPDLSLDYVFSIGVIHHIPEPEATVSACYEALKPGGKCLFWVYGKEGNELYLSLFGPLRRLTSRMPHGMLSALCHLLNVILDVYILFCRTLPLPLRDYVLNVIGKFARDKRYLVIYDQLNPAYAKYYTEAEAKALLAEAGFEDVKTYHRHGYSWTVCGTRPLNGTA